MPKEYQCALNKATAERDLPLKKGQMLDLRSHFQQHFTDPRRTNRTYPASSLLVLICMALFAGHSTLTRIQSYGRLLSQQQRAWLDFPFKKGSAVRKVPSWRGLYNFLSQIDATGASTGNLCAKLFLPSTFFRINEGKANKRRRTLVNPELAEGVRVWMKFRAIRQFSPKPDDFGYWVGLTSHNRRP